MRFIIKVHAFLHEPKANKCIPDACIFEKKTTNVCVQISNVLNKLVEIVHTVRTLFFIAHQEARAFTILTNLSLQVHNHKTHTQNADTVSIFKLGQYNAGKVASTLQYRMSLSMSSYSSTLIKHLLE